MNLGYYPGCSLHATAREFSESLHAVVQRLEVSMQEIDDWACCGASSAHGHSHLLSVALPARTLALAEEQGMDSILAPCAACYGRLAGASHELETDAELADKVRGILQRPLENNLEIINVVAFLQGLAKQIETRITSPLSGFKFACYYGCLLLRPPEVTRFDDPEDPSSMESLVELVGGEALPWNQKTTCCGAGMSLSRTGSVIRLGRTILDDARAAGADAVVVACPMCHSNLDMRQAAMNAQGGTDDLPILYVTELVGLALGIDPKVMGLHRHYVSTAPLLTRLNAARKALTDGKEVS